MNYVVLNETTSHKHLGLTISNTCYWTEHINNIAEAAWSRLNLVRLFKFKINRKALEEMYIAFIHLLLEYSDSVWDNSPANVKKHLDDIHYEAARIITGGTKLCSHDKLLSDLGWALCKNVAQNINW